MSNKVNTKCRDCRYCSAPSIIETSKPTLFYVGAPKRKIVYRCTLGINHNSIKGEIMIIGDESDFKCRSFSRK